MLCPLLIALSMLATSTGAARASQHRDLGLVHVCSGSHLAAHEFACRRDESILTSDTFESAVMLVGGGDTADFTGTHLAFIVATPVGGGYRERGRVEVSTGGPANGYLWELRNVFSHSGVTPRIGGRYRIEADEADGARAVLGMADFTIAADPPPPPGSAHLTLSCARAYASTVDCAFAGCGFRPHEGLRIA